MLQRTKLREHTQEKIESSLTTKYSYTQAKHKCVAEVETGLEKAWHFGLYVVIINRVKVHIGSCRSSRKEWSPLPMVVLGIQQEICTHNGYTDGDNDEDKEDKQHETIDIIHL